MSVKPVPEGCEGVIPYIVVRGVPEAIAFYTAAFGAKEITVKYLPDGKTVMHAEVEVAGGKLYLSEECPQWGSKSPLTLDGTAVSLHMFVPDVDATFARAEKHGAKV